MPGADREGAMNPGEKKMLDVQAFVLINVKRGRIVCCSSRSGFILRKLCESVVQEITLVRSCSSGNLAFV